MTPSGDRHATNGHEHVWRRRVRPELNLILAQTALSGRARHDALLEPPPSRGSGWGPYQPPGQGGGPGGDPGRAPDLTPSRRPSRDKRSRARLATTGPSGIELDSGSNSPFGTGPSRRPFGATAIKGGQKGGQAHRASGPAGAGPAGPAGS